MPSCRGLGLFLCWLGWLGWHVNLDVHSTATESTVAPRFRRMHESTFVCAMGACGSEDQLPSFHRSTFRKQLPRLCKRTNRVRRSERTQVTAEPEPLTELDASALETARQQGRLLRIFRWIFTKNTASTDSHSRRSLSLAPRMLVLRISRRSLSLAPRNASLVLLWGRGGSPPAAAPRGWRQRRPRGSQDARAAQRLQAGAARDDAAHGQRQALEPDARSFTKSTHFEVDFSATL